MTLQEIADSHVLGRALDVLRDQFEGFELIAHWTQGEFHHDLVLRVHAANRLPAPILVVSTNCNGGVKEILAFDEVPDRWALWHHRCPEEPEFDGDLPAIRGCARTVHWFDPCELISPAARSEIRPEFRQRERGGGWRLRKSD
ncbi:MAG: hypothetical protein AAGF12_00465 [Myxococcota bacterium]